MSIDAVTLFIVAGITVLVAIVTVLVWWATRVRPDTRDTWESVARDYPRNHSDRLPLEWK